MAIQQNIDHIQTTHIGSLPRPHHLLDLLKAKVGGKSFDEAEWNTALSKAVADCVRKQVECGIDTVTDGEYSKTGFFTYIRERLEGFESRPGEKRVFFAKEAAAFPEYYAEYFQQAMMGGAVAPAAPVVCVGPLKYRGEEFLKRDITNVKNAAKAAGVADEHVFLPATAPSGVGANEYYNSEEEYFHTVALEMGTEYRTIVASGILVQVDDPFLSDIFVDPRFDARQKRRRAQIYVEAVNTGLKGIPVEKVRFHTCYGINEGPRIHEAALAEVLPFALRIHAGQYSFEAANPRHEHEYHLFERIKIPKGKVICPGVVTQASNIVEHPEWIAERILRYAKLVGRENVMAGSDCGFSSQASYKTEVHPTVIWEKFKAMRLGADIATKKLWPSKRSKPRTKRRAAGKS